jgi:hypothetical protein
VQQIIAELASQMPFAEARSTFQRLVPATLAVSTVESITATVANEVQQEQQREIDEAFCPATSRFPVAEQTPKGKYAVVASDGGMCRIKKQDQYSEFKVGVLGTVDPSSPDEDRVREKAYVATLGNCDRIFQQIHIEFARKGLDRCSLLQFLGDGADWIWRRASLLAAPGQRLLLTLDFFHAMEYVQAAANAAFADRETEESNRWVHEMSTYLKEGDNDAFFAELKRQQRKWSRKHRPGKDDEQPLRDVLRYFTDRRTMLTYAECRTLGLPIGSGMVEGGVRFVGKDRLHRTGMAWTPPGAEGILQLRCLRVSNRWDSFFKNQATQRFERYSRAMAVRLRA